MSKRFFDLTRSSNPAHHPHQPAAVQLSPDMVKAWTWCLRMSRGISNDNRMGH